MHKTSAKNKADISSLPGKTNRLINLSGLLLSFGIAAGGLFLVQTRLEKEENALLQSGGTVTAAADSAESQKAESTQITGMKLTEEQIALILDSLESASDIFPHEPGPGQLSMAEAVEYGRTWLDDFFLPHMGTSFSHPVDYKADCYLWTPVQEAAGDKSALSLSCWTVNLSSQEIQAALVIHAVSGQVLSASINCSFPEESASDPEFLSLLQEYGDSFGLGTADFLLSPKDQENAQSPHFAMYQRLGDAGIYAAIETNSIHISIDTSPFEIVEYRGILNLLLYLTAHIE